MLQAYGMSRTVEWQNKGLLLNKMDLYDRMQDISLLHIVPKENIYF